MTLAVACALCTVTPMTLSPGCHFHPGAERGSGKLPLHLPCHGDHPDLAVGFRRESGQGAQGGFSGCRDEAPRSPGSTPYACQLSSQQGQHKDGALAACPPWAPSSNSTQPAVCTPTPSRGGPLMSWLPCLPAPCSISTGGLHQEAPLTTHLLAKFKDPLNAAQVPAPSLH